MQSGFERQRQEARVEARKEDARRRARLLREQKQAEMDRELADFAAHTDRYGRGANFGHFGEATDQARAREREREAWAALFSGRKDVF